MKAALYTRVSTSQQIDGVSLQLQEERLRSYAAAMGWEVAEVYIDAGLSGASADRPEYQRMMADAKDRRFDVILVYKLDRLTRSVRDFHELTDLLDSYGVGLVSVTQNIDTSSPTGRLLRNILVDFANFERELIAERTSEAKRQRAQEGQFMGGQAPFGYRKVGSSKTARLELVAEEASIVKEIFRLYLTREYGMRQLAVRFGLNVSHIHRILNNPVYTGRLGYGKTREGKPGVKQRRPFDEWLIAEGEHDAIITWEEYQEAQKIRAENFSNPGARTTRRHLFSRMVYCASCGEPCYYYPQTRHGRLYQYYRCRSYNRPDEPCLKTSVRQEAIEKAFVRWLSYIVDEHRFWAEVEQLTTATDDDASPLRSELESLQAQRTRVVRRIDNLVESLADGEMVDIIRPRLIELQEEQLSLERNIEQIESEIAALAQASPSQSWSVMRDISANWPHMTTEEKRDGVRVLVRRFVVDGPQVTIHWTDRRVSPTRALLPHGPFPGEPVSKNR